LKFVKWFRWGFTCVLRIIPFLNIIFPLYTNSYINHIIHCCHFYPEDGSVWPSETSANFSTRTQKQINYEKFMWITTQILNLTFYNLDCGVHVIK
jgi:hypothetical protein